MDFKVSHVISSEGDADLYLAICCHFSDNIVTFPYIFLYSHIYFWVHELQNKIRIYVSSTKISPLAFTQNFPACCTIILVPVTHTFFHLEVCNSLECPVQQKLHKSKSQQKSKRNLVEKKVLNVQSSCCQYADPFKPN